MTRIERLPVVVRPGWDCLHGECPFPPHGRKHLGGASHGIHGDEFHYVIRTRLVDGRLAALSLAVYTDRYPVTVPRTQARLYGANGASLDMHIQPRPDDAPHPYRYRRDTCDWLDGGMCESDGSCLTARDLYRDHGIQTDDPAVDLTAQPESLWLAMERQFERWLESAELAATPHPAREDG